MIAGADSITVKLADGSSYQATVVGSDAGEQAAPVDLADSSLVQVGDAAVAIGDQYGLVDSLTTGVVSALGRTITSPDGSSFKAAIQTDAAINEGSSGGPLLSDQGDVIGVTSQIASSSGGSIGIGYAIPSNTVKTVADGLIAGA